MAEDYGLKPPIEFPELAQWLGQYVEAEFKTQDGLRQEKVSRQSFSWRVLKGYDCDEAGHGNVAPEHRHKEMLMSRLFDIWPKKVASRIFPDGSKWLNFEPENDKDPADVEQAEVAEAAFWPKMNDDGDNMGDWAADMIFESGYGFGAVGRVSADYEIDHETGAMKVVLCKKIYPFKDFVLDRNCPDWKRSFLIVRHRYSREQIMALSQEVQGENGELLRGPIFDAEAVKKLLADNQDGVNSPGNAALTNDGQQLNGSGGTANKDWFDCFEYLGPMSKDGKVIGKNMMITTCNGVCLRAKDTEGPRKWVLFGSARGSMDDPYPESKGWDVANLENKINLYETAGAFAQMVSVFGVQTFKTERADDVAQWGEAYTLAPGRQVPDIFGMLDYKADTSTITRIKAENTKTANEYMGVSNADLAGAPQSNVTATESQGVQAGAESRISYDARHYSPLFKEFVSIMWRCFLDAWDVEFVRMDGRSMEVAGDAMQNFKGKMNIMSIGNSNAAPIKAAQMQQAMPILIQAVDRGLADPVEVYRTFLDRATGLDQVLIRKLIRAPEPPPPMPGVMPDQQQGPPVDPVPMPPPGLRAVG